MLLCLHLFCFFAVRLSCVSRLLFAFCLRFYCYLLWSVLLWVVDFDFIARGFVVGFVALLICFTGICFSLFVLGLL